MIRAQRRQCQNDTVAITPKMALDYELTDSWPNRAERNRFWFRLTVPAHLRFPPDPRKHLNAYMSDSATASEAKRATQAEHDAWRSERIKWLRSQV